MKQIKRMIQVCIYTLFLFFIIGSTQTYAWYSYETYGDLTFIINNKNSISYKGTPPTGMKGSGSMSDTAPFLNAGEKESLTLSGFDNTKITEIAVYMLVSDLSNSGYLSFYVGGENVFSIGSMENPVEFTDSSWNGSGATSFEYHVFSLDIAVAEGEEICLEVGCVTGSFTCSQMSYSYSSYELNSIDYFTKQSAVASMRFNYMEAGMRKKTEYYYSLCDSIEDLSMGDQFILVDSVTKEAMSKTFAKEEVNVENQEILKVSNTTAIFTLEDGTLPNTYALSINEEYLENTSTMDASSLGFNSTKSSTTDFRIDIVESKAYLTTNIEGISTNMLSSNSTAFQMTDSEESSLAIYVYQSREIEVKKYIYSNAYLKYGMIFTKEMHDNILAIEPDATFGIAISKDGIHWSYSEITPTRVSYQAGKTVKDPNGEYYQIYAAIPVPEENFGTVVYAKGYISYGGAKKYAKAKAYSIKTLAEAYIGLEIEPELLDGLLV